MANLKIRVFSKFSQQSGNSNSLAFGNISGVGEKNGATENATGIACCCIGAICFMSHREKRD